MNTFFSRYGSIRARIDDACGTVGRDPAGVTLIAVSKNHGIDDIRALYDLGQRHFGESRLQEAEPKIAALPADVVWHFVGNLQSNKARKIADLFAYVQSVAKESQMLELQKSHSETPVFIECNIAEEPQKGGCFPEKLDDCISLLLNYNCVRLYGLMTVGPAMRNPEAMRPFFRKMRELRDSLAPGTALSMGMSADYDVAIQEGSTHVRIGTALFGPRKT